LARRVAADILRIMADTIFGKIIAGEVPCHRVYEDERVLAFLDIGPLCEGHTLVIPKTPAETIDQLPDEDAAAVGRVLPRLCRAVMEATGAGACNVLQNNGSMAHQAVRHVHFHIIPKRSRDEGLLIDWRPGALDDAAGKAMAERIRASLEGGTSL